MDKAPDAFRTISEVAEQLDVPQHVLRFWESRFPQIRPMKRGGGRRYYRPEDVDLLRGIRHLLYGEGYTIRGVQRILRDQGVGFVQGVWQAGAEQPSLSPGDDDEAADDIAAVESEAPAKPERSRSLFGALPSLRDRTVESDEVVPERREPTLLPATVSLPAAAPRLAHHQMQKLQQALDELQECRRLIDAALAANH